MQLNTNILFKLNRTSKSAHTEEVCAVCVGEKWLNGETVRWFASCDAKMTYDYALFSVNPMHST